jgi:hypothetical protein
VKILYMSVLTFFFSPSAAGFLAAAFTFLGALLDAFLVFLGAAAFLASAAGAASVFLAAAFFLGAAYRIRNG